MGSFSTFFVTYADNYDMFVQQNDPFGQGIVIGKANGDVVLAIYGGAKLVTSAPKLFSTALKTLKATGKVTIKGVTLVYINGKIARAAKNLPPTVLKTPEPVVMRVIKPGNTIELFTDATGPKIKGALGVGPEDPTAIAKDVRKLSNVLSGSQNEVIANNPYIPRDAGGRFTIMDYLPEAARITKPGGKIIINGTKHKNKYIDPIPDSDTLAKMHLLLKYNGTLRHEFRKLDFKTSNGRRIDKDNMKTIIFEKIR